MAGRLLLIADRPCTRHSYAMGRNPTERTSDLASRASPGKRICCGSVRVPRVTPVWSRKKAGAQRRSLRTAFLSIGSVALSACDLRGAPSYSIFGAYFPAWLLCSAIGIVGSVGLRAAVVASGLEDAIPLRLLVYVGFATAVALWLWLSLFGGQ